MQPTKTLSTWLDSNTNHQHFLFLFQDLRSFYPDLSETAFKTLLSRAVHAGYLERVCRGLYTNKKSIPADGLFLFHVAAQLRSKDFNYVSLETVLSAAGVISQVPINWITIMSSGRSNIVSCGKFGSIEFIHTDKRPTDIIDQLIYDSNSGMWRASVALALKDMKATHRNCDLIDWDLANELI